MRDLRLLDKYRCTSPDIVALYGCTGDETCGAFMVPSPADRATLRIIASADQGWDHVSVSRKNRCPNWIEMEHVKRLFFKDGETAMQLHVPPAEHINCDPHCLHIWRPQYDEIPPPPAVDGGAHGDPHMSVAGRKARITKRIGKIQQAIQTAVSDKGLWAAYLSAEERQRNTNFVASMRAEIQRLREKYRNLA